MINLDERKLINNIYEKEVVDFLQMLIRTNSENPPGNEKKMGEIIANKLKDMGCKVELQYIEDDRFNVIGVIEGESKEKILFNGHMDTVKAGNSDDWNLSPFSGEIIDGRMYGLGTTDMKSGLTAMIFALQSIIFSGMPLKKGIMFTAVIDEEVLFKGTKALLHSNKLRDCVMGFVSEPSSLNIATTQKGGVEFKAVTHGKSAHAGVAFTGESAIYKMNKVIYALEKYNQSLKDKINLPFLKYPTVNVGKIQGGTGVTLVPDYCEIEFDRQVFPTEDITTVVKEVNDVVEKLDLEEEIKVTLKEIQRFNTWKVSKSEDVVKKLTYNYIKHFKKDPIYSGFNGYSEVELLANHGIPSVIFGPGDIALAHAPNENVVVQEVIDATKIYALIAYNYAVK